MGEGDGSLEGEECECLEGLTETEAEVLELRGKNLVCDLTCTDGTDLVWGK